MDGVELGLLIAGLQHRLTQLEAQVNEILAWRPSLEPRLGQVEADLAEAAADLAALAADIAEAAAAAAESAAEEETEPPAEEEATAETEEETEEEAEEPPAPEVRPIRSGSFLYRRIGRSAS